MKKIFLTVLAALTIGSLAVAGEPSKLVVHEWGTFTSIAGANGVALEYRPLTGVSDLPSFVYTSMDPDRRGVRGASHGKDGLWGNARMETPVIYFYSDREQKVDVKVDFPKGKITEYYPRANLVKDGTIDFGPVLVKPKDAYPHAEREATSNHYFRAREVDADMIRVCSGQGHEYEKFLFYRGVGTFELPVTAKLLEEGNKLRVEGLTGSAIVFENRKGRSSYRVISSATGTVEVERPDVTRVPCKSARIPARELVAILVAEGLYEKEAKAMVATWKDSWFEEGLRVLYILPRQKTDEVLPLTISPKPTELVRVLVGRAEVITPELEADVLAAVAKLGAEEFAERDAAQKTLAKHGRFARPILETALRKTHDAEVTARIRELLSNDETK